MSFGEFQWVELLYGFFGSFVGFLLALLTDNYIKKSEEKSKIKTLLKSIHAECRSIYNHMQDNTGDNDSMMLFSTFVWDSITATDFFPTLLYEEPEKCALLIEIYSELNALKELQIKFFDYTEEIGSIKSDILTLIDQFEVAMKNVKKDSFIRRKERL